MPRLVIERHIPAIGRALCHVPAFTPLLVAEVIFGFSKKLSANKHHNTEPDDWCF